MGIVLDSSIIITAERRSHTVREILEQVKAAQGGIEVGLSVVTIAQSWGELYQHIAFRTSVEPVPACSCTNNFSWRYLAAWNLWQYISGRAARLARGVDVAFGNLVLKEKP